MTNKPALKCIDLNSPYCPCLLADTNHCLFCSHLMGRTVCDCDWSGVCALYEKKWQAKIKDSYRTDLDIAVPVRIETETKFGVAAQICPNTYEIEFGVPPELAQALDRAGAFVFLRRPEDQQFYLFPVGVMSIEGNVVKVVIEAVGTKSARLFSEGNRGLFVRGPYYNGVFGQPWIEKLESGKVLLLSGGMGQPPALPIAHKLIKGGNSVTAILAPGKTGKIFIAERLKDMGVTVRETGSMRRWGLNMMREIITDKELCPELIVSSGPDEQHYAIISAMSQAGVNIPMAATNNNTMCCGEGVCGSCERKTKTGVKLRTCKAQIDFTQLEPPQKPETLNQILTQTSGAFIIK